MRAAVLERYGDVPEASEFREPSVGAGQTVVEMAAAGIHHVDRIKASGGFYLVKPDLPTVVGSDGVGRLSDGHRVYFESIVLPFGTFAEHALAPSDELFEIPEGISDVQAAALGNTGMAGWLSLSWRARLEQGETVLVLGADGALGTVALQAARLMGAGRVVGATMQRSLDRVRHADAVVALDGPHPIEALRDACEGGADIIIDPLWGLPAVASMGAAKHAARLVQLGQMAGLSVELSSPILRAKRLDLLGFAYLHAPVEVRRTAYWDLATAVVDGRIEVPFEVVPLERVGEAWTRQAQGPRQKLVIDIHADPSI